MNEQNGEVTLDDRELDIPVYSPVCTFCQHVRLEPRRTCAAFPDGIPLEIWMGDNKHTSAVRGDHGVMFELSDNVSIEVAKKNNLPSPTEDRVGHS